MDYTIRSLKIYKTKPKTELTQKFEKWRFDEKWNGLFWNVN
jgi:hypothetical protein